MFCSKCGTENPDGARFCASCGVALATVAPAQAPPPPPPVRGAEAAATPMSPATGPTGKTPWVAALLSCVITGAGQLYNNDWKKGIAMFVGAVLGLMFTAGVATIGIWVWSMIDGYQVASGKGKVW
jgi:TM2 domain-containing membrane protein YozV